MNVEKQSRKTLSLPVLSVNEGEHLGYVKSLIVDPAKREVCAFVINQKGWFKEDKIIPFNRVKNIGENAIVIDKSGTAEKPANFPQIIKLIKNPARIINSKVVSSSGKSLGHVEEFYFDATGKITKFELSSKFTEGLWKGKTLLPSEEIITIGKDVIIVADGAEDRLINEGKPLKQTMSGLKSVTAKAWDTTVQTSQKLGQAITNSINKLAEEEKSEKKDPEEIELPENQPEESPSPDRPDDGNQEEQAAPGPAETGAPPEEILKPEPEISSDETSDATGNTNDINESKDSKE